ncbi:MAG TPA: hypothetical protein P5161_04115, partial [Eubacteriales bacterium]|nr:hypothetical protein [Eubacteriales bacterium]
ILEANYSSLSINFILNSLVLATITSFIYALSEFISYKFPKVSFDGYGGRLGTIAFISVILYILILKFGFNKNFNFFSNENIFKTKLDYFLLFAIVSSIIASLISMEIKNTVSSLNENYKVITVATTGLIGGILITKIPEYGLDYGLAWYTGAFVGMSSYYVLMLKRHFFISGLFAGIYFILTRNIFIGVGGKLGFISFLSVISMRILSNGYNFLKGYFKPPDKIIEELESGNIEDQRVDDNYAEKLVESLLKAKDKINISQNDIGNFVIGEKIDIQQYEEEKKKNISRLFSISETRLAKEKQEKAFSERGLTPPERPITFAEAIKRLNLDFSETRELLDLDWTDDNALETAVNEIKYRGYIKKEEAKIKEQQRLEEKLIPEDIDYRSLSGLRTEAREKLQKIRPRSIGQAGRISGVSPADIAVLLVYLRNN